MDFTHRRPGFLRHRIQHAGRTAEYLVYSGLLILCTALLSPQAADAAATGKITGTVSDSGTGKGLSFVNVVVRGTIFGTASDADGRFELGNLPPGRYELLFTMIGYERTVRKDVPVRAGETTRLRVELAETAVRVQELVVTASKRAQRINESPSSIAVATSGELERQNQIYLEQLLEQVPGVNFMGSQVNIRGSSGFSYGVGSRVLFLVDGVPVLSGDSGEIKWDLIPADQIDRIEIVKSAGSALYGSSALGGVINVITREPSLRSESNVRLSSGVYDDPPWPEWKWTDRLLYFTDFDVSHSRRIGKARTHFSVGRHQSTGYRQNGEYLKYNAAGKIFFNLTSQSNLTLQGHWEDSDSEIGLMWRNRHQALEVTPAAVGDRAKSNRVMVQGIHQWAVRRNLGLKNRFSWFRNHFNNLLHDNRDWSTSQRFGFESQTNWIPSRSHSMTFGMEHTLDHVTADPLGNHDIFTASGYVQDEIRMIPTIILTLGARYDHTITDSDLRDQRISPKLGCVWHVTEKTAIRLASGRGFRAPSMYERFPNLSAAGIKIIPNLALKPESAWSHEIGIASPLCPFILLDAAVFMNDYWNLIEPVPDATNTVQFTNLTRARIRGLETTLRFSLFGRFLTGQLGYTWLDPQDLETGEILAYRSRHMVRASLTGQYRNIEAGLDYVFNDRLDAVKVYPNDPRVAQKTLNARASVDFGWGSLSLNAGNILNHMHTQVERTIMPIRNYVATIRVKR
ncbi:MAG TPA: TonB-dependent receptor [bacterium]|nr:TonB-dependent receptor [bacterium]